MSGTRTVLIVEDEEIIRKTLREVLVAEGYDLHEAGTVEDALKLAHEMDFDVAICDVQLPDGDGIALLRRLHQMNPHTCILIITAYATVENAVEAFKAGAFDYLVKPVLFEDLLHKLERLYEFRNLYFENQSLRRELIRQDNFNEIIGSSRAIQSVEEQIRKVAVTNANVLLVGETGTGKEMFARSIHAAGPKKDEQFLAMNCGSPVRLVASRPRKVCCCMPARAQSFSTRLATCRSARRPSCCGRLSTRKSFPSAAPNRRPSKPASSLQRPANSPAKSRRNGFTRTCSIDSTA